MTIERGKAWGGAAVVAAGLPVARHDDELAEIVQRGTQTQAVLLAGGDLARTVGATTIEPPEPGSARPHLPIDVGVARIGGSDRFFVAHLIVRRRWWADTRAVLNSAFVGTWNAAPRAHPNDGRLDTISAQLSIADRWKARSRLHSGTHVPHPDIEIRRATSGRIELGAGDRLWLDGRLVPAGGVVEWHVRPDAFTIVI